MRETQFQLLDVATENLEYGWPLGLKISTHRQASFLK
jgi:hypothetical protein